MILSYTRSDFDDLKAGKVKNELYPDFGDLPYYQSIIDGKDTTLINHESHLQKNTAFSQENLHFNSNVGNCPICFQGEQKTCFFFQIS